MTITRQRLLQLLLTVVLVALNLAAVNYLIAGWSTARVDLTEEGLFSISPATKRILDSVDEDVTIYGYFSDRTHPKLAPLVPEVTDLLEEYRALSGGRVQVEILDPGQDEEVEQEAADRYGVQSTPFALESKYETGIVNAFFSLVVRYGDQYERYSFRDLIEIEPLGDDVEVRLRNLEYDLTRAIKKVVYGFRDANELFEQIEEPVRLTAILSESTLPEVFREAPQALRTAAEELAERGGDKFVFEEIDADDPEALATAEARFGVIRPMSLDMFSADSFYLYALLEVGGRLEQVVLTDDAITAAAVREAIESSLKRQTPGFLKTVGIVTPDAPEMPAQVRLQMGLPPQPPPEFGQIKQYLGQDYQVEDVQLFGTQPVPTNIDVLLVLKPSALDEKKVYALDQYVMRGGRLILCAEKFEADFSQGLAVQSVETGLTDWLAHLGVTIEPTLVLDDRNQSLPIPEIRYTAVGPVQTLTMAPYPYLVQVGSDGFGNADITASLDTVGIYWGSPLEVDVGAIGEGVEVLPILKSSERSWTSDDLNQVGFVDYEIPEETSPSLLAVALAGRFDSYFADKPVPGADERAEALQATDPNDPTTAVTSAPPVTLERSPETRVVVIGNAAFLSDFVAATLGGFDGGFFIENLRFIQNVIDWTSLDNEMLDIRARGLVSRRLDPVASGNQVTIETINYVAPVLVLMGLGAWTFYRRRSAAAERPGRAAIETTPRQGA